MPNSQSKNLEIRRFDPGRFLLSKGEFPLDTVIPEFLDPGFLMWILT